MPPLLRFTISCLAVAVALALVSPTEARQAPSRGAGEKPIAIMLIKADDGGPLEGGRVLAGYERLHPAWGEAWWRTSALTDEQGRAALPASTEEASYSRVVAMAPGFGTRMIYPRERDGIEELIEMPPEVPLTLELVFPDGSPAARVHVGVAFGCGHTPDVISGVTDARGQLTLFGLSPVGDDNDFELYPAGDEVRTVALDFDEDWEAGQVERVVVERGVPVSGRVIDRNGMPAAGIYVGQPSSHRGPWTRTDAEGRFRLLGTDPDQDFLEFRDSDGRWVGSRSHSGRGLDVIVHLRDESVGAAPPPRFPGRVDLSSSESLVNIGDVDIEFWSVHTGQHVIASPKRDGVCEVMLDEGWYFVEVGAAGGPIEPVSAGAIHVGPSDSAVLGPRSIQLTVPPITVRAIEIKSEVKLAAWRFRRADGEASGPGPERRFGAWWFFGGTRSEAPAHWASIERRWLPPGEGWALEVQPCAPEDDPGRTMPWLATVTVEDDGEMLTLETR